jgi:hypothetical protein
MFNKLLRSARLVSLAAIFCASAAQAATTYDVVKDFSIKSNPNGVWTYMDSAPLA